MSKPDYTRPNYFNTEGLVSIRETIRLLEGQIADLEWQGEPTKPLEDALEYYKMLENNGETYVPNF